MPEYHFEYTTQGTRDTLTRDEAVAALHTRASNVVINLYPGTAEVTVSAGTSIFGDPEVLVSGWGYLSPIRAERQGLVLIEAAKLAADAAR